jgi:hypothetical protein
MFMIAPLRGFKKTQATKITNLRNSLINIADTEFQKACFSSTSASLLFSRLVYELNRLCSASNSQKQSFNQWLIFNQDVIISEAIIFVFFLCVTLFLFLWLWRFLLFYFRSLFLLSEQALLLFRFISGHGLGFDRCGGNGIRLFLL